MKRSSLTLADIERDTRLRLDVAAAIAFPDGGVTAANLRREAARGRLKVSRIGNKDFTTLAAIDEMYDACQLRRESGSTSDQADQAMPPSGSSATETAKRARDAALARLNAPDRYARSRTGERR